MQGGSPVGYLLYLAMILLPGLGISELLGLGRKAPDIASRVGYAIGFGLAADTVFFAVKTLGVSVGPTRLLGFGLWAPSVVIALGAVSVGASAVTGRWAPRLPRPTKYDCYVLGLAALVGAFALLEFAKYPVFPMNFTADFTRHVETGLALQNGTEGTVPRQILYGGIGYQLGSAFLFVGGVPLVVAQRIAAILLVLSVPLVYTASGAIFGSPRAAVLTAGLYSASGLFWYVAVFDSGLYANLFGVMVTLFLVAVFLKVIDDPGARAGWLGLGVAIGAAYFSHFTTVSVFPSFAAVAVLYLVNRSPNTKRALVGAAAVFLPGLAGAALLPEAAHLAIVLSYQGGGTILLSTRLASLLAPVPQLSYLAVVVNDDLALLAISAMAGAAVYWSVKKRKALAIVPASWFIVLLALAPSNVSAWRFDLEATVPLLLLAGYGLHCLLPQKKAGKRKRMAGSDPYWVTVIAVVVLLVAPAVVGSWVWYGTQDATSNVRVASSDQEYVYDALSWLQTNTANSSRYLSVTEPEILYTNLMLGRNGTFSPFVSAQDTLEFASAYHFGYLMVTLNSSIAIGDQAWTAFDHSANFSLVYSNPDVKVFLIT